MLRAPGATGPSIRFMLKRFGQALITLLLLSVFLFVAVTVLPGDPGRRILGPFADPRAVAQLNAELGTDRPLLVQYGVWLGGVLTGNLGESYAFRRPVADMLGPSLVNSAKLAILAFIMVIPLSIAGGVIAAINRDKLLDRFISISGITATAIPEFVWAVCLLAIFGLWLDILPVTARAPQGADFLTEVKYLLLPASCLMFVLFGYIARMTRTATIESLDADYTRTAVLKGISRWTLIRRHVLRNSLLPTISVVAISSGYLVGGLVAVELIFNYSGVGRLVFLGAQHKDIPIVQSTVLVIGAVYLATTFVADVLYVLLNPRIRLRSNDAG